MVTYPQIYSLIYRFKANYPRKNGPMIKNYLTVALRKLTKSKGYVIIHILGMGLPWRAVYRLFARCLQH